eukprot:858753-Amphidinium_carterae.1
MPSGSDWASLAPQMTCQNLKTSTVSLINARSKTHTTSCMTWTGLYFLYSAPLTCVQLSDAAVKLTSCSDIFCRTVPPLKYVPPSSIGPMVVFLATHAGAPGALLTAGALVARGTPGLLGMPHAARSRVTWSTL